MKTKSTRYVHLYDAAQLQAWLEDRAAYRDTWYLRWGDAFLNLAPWLILLTGFVWAWAELVGG